MYCYVAVFRVKRMLSKHDWESQCCKSSYAEAYNKLGLSFPRNHRIRLWLSSGQLTRSHYSLYFMLLSVNGLFASYLFVLCLIVYLFVMCRDGVCECQCATEYFKIPWIKLYHVTISTSRFCS